MHVQFVVGLQQPPGFELRDVTAIAQHTVSNTCVITYKERIAGNLTGRTLYYTVDGVNQEDVYGDFVSVCALTPTSGS